jgi:hypothetical protein
MFFAKTASNLPRPTGQTKIVVEEKVRETRAPQLAQCFGVFLGRWRVQRSASVGLAVAA